MGPPPCSTAFGNKGIRYIPADRTKSELYLACEPLFSRGQVELLDDRKLFHELRNLERRTRRGGRDLVDHPPRAHDDIANAACGVIANLASSDRKIFPELTRKGIHVQV